LLRASWFAAAWPPGCVATAVAVRGDGEPAAAIPITRRRLGPLSIAEVPGSYWPFRSFPIAADASEVELADLLASDAARRMLGRIWRIGPVLDDDPTIGRLREATRLSGWTMLTRQVATCFELDLKRLRAEGQWPTASHRRENRRSERMLAARGEVEFRYVSGNDWSAEIVDLLARIEGESWITREGIGPGAKFLHPENRRMWDRVLADPVLTEMMHCALLFVDGEPAAFSFGIECGAIRYQIATTYSSRFAQQGPGRVLLYRNLERAADRGIEQISWGAGDGGYKSRMGGRPGAAILDHLLVRPSALATLLRPFWERSAR
jgi:CelD/BcsL family acetyltransferase involved in cellulose biosynthesis